MNKPKKVAKVTPVYGIYIYIYQSKPKKCNTPIYIKIQEIMNI